MRKFIQNFLTSPRLLKSQFFELSQKDFLQSKYEIEQNLKKQIEQNEIELEILKSVPLVPVAKNCTCLVKLFNEVNPFEKVVTT